VIVAGSAIAEPAVGLDAPSWREDLRLDAQLALGFRKAFEGDVSGPITYTGRLPVSLAGASPENTVYIWSTSPSSHCPRHPPSASAQGFIDLRDDGRFDGSIGEERDMTGEGIVGPSVRACAYLVHSGFNGSRIVARAQAVGKPLGNPGTLELAAILALLLGAIAMFIMWLEKWSPKARARCDRSESADAPPTPSPPSIPPKHTWPADDPPWRRKPAVRSSPQSPSAGTRPPSNTPPRPPTAPSPSPGTWPPSYTPPRPAAPPSSWPGALFPPRDIPQLQRPPARPARPRCHVCVKPNGEGKVIYADEEDARTAVRITQERRAAGKPAPDLQRAYYEQRCGNWHVTSQAAA